MLVTIKLIIKKLLRNILFDNGFDQLIKSCTRITSESETLIDIVLSNSPNNISHTGIIFTSGLSDHIL